MAILGCLAATVWLCCGCSKKEVISSVEADSNAWVSIGVVNTYDIQKRLPVFEFFISNHIASYPEGYPNCKVMVRTQDVELAKHILMTNRPPGTNFESIWDGH
jgi:hypothetical protein